MSRGLHLIYIFPFLFATHSAPARQRREGGERQTDEGKKERAPMPRCPGLLLSPKCSDGGGRREGDNESGAAFQDGLIVLIVQTGERREGKKEMESVFFSERKEREGRKKKPGFSPCNVLEQLYTNPVIMHIFWKHGKAAWKRGWPPPPTAAHCLILGGVLAKQCADLRHILPYASVREMCPRAAAEMTTNTTFS